ncbi:Tyrosine recombinase XerD [Shewanella sp. P1-14-1]|uniref:tyrosine-type recombinase/integrase n=1 Tax=Shewanella sp. P1-14-1 TaxID=1723761 RepID=UPI0006D67F86|nr:site-specific integrase [Shewanella sp. P1-14-1]KPZ69945.1 Tyrosine recombinase XerD [Shewanella sp. P1-14-1]
MERFKFTKTKLQTIAGKGISYNCGDTEIKELQLLFTSKGGLVFKLVKKHQGKKLTITLGEFGSMTVEQARKAALENLELLRQGINPNEQKKAARERRLNRFRFSDLFDSYKADFKVRITAGERRPKSLEDAECIFTLHTNPLFDKDDVRDLTNDQARQIIARLKASKSPSVSNKCLTQIKSVFNYAKREGLIAENHFAVAKKFAEQPRERVLTEEEEARLLTALEDEPQIYKDIVLIALMTGQRKSCVLSLRWEEIDPLQKIWAIPASKAKSKKGLVVPLIPTAMEILNRRSQDAEDGEVFVFPNKRSKSGHVVEKTGQGSFWRRVTQRAGLYSDNKAQRLTFHDLRRSTATRMARSGIELAIIQKALGHSSIAITQRTYAHHDLSQVRAGLEQICAPPQTAVDTLKEQLQALTPEQRKELLGGL